MKLCCGQKFKSSQVVCDQLGAKIPPFSATADLPEKTKGQLWFPHENNASENWINTLVQGEELILEIALKDLDHVAKTIGEGRTRLVFMKKEGDGEYTFLGVYKLDEIAHKSLGCCVWKRISKVYSSAMEF